MKRLLILCFLVSLFCFVAKPKPVFAATIWTTGAYSNNEDRTQMLSVSGSSCLAVTVTGATEKSYDYIYIYDKNGTKVKSLTGSINETFTVNGSMIIARLVSDYSVTGTGATVSVRDCGSSGTSSTWTTGAYSNNANLSKKLIVSGASCLSVTVTGATEKGYDYVSIYDSNSTKVKSLSGSINETFTVNGSSILARLVSDSSITDKGVTVTARAGNNCTVRINNVPFQSQLSASCSPNYLCGFACASMLTSFLHHESPTVKLMQDMAAYETGQSCPTVLTGVENCLSAAKYVGNAPNSYWAWLTFDEIKSLLAKGIPVSVSVKYSKFGNYRLDPNWNRGHRVVVVGYSASQGIWIIHDPLGKTYSNGAYREIPSDIFRAAMQQIQIDVGNSGNKFDVLIVQ